MKILVKFFWDCKRSGKLEGLFVTTKEEVASMMGKFANFGDLLGKYSDLAKTLEESDITIITEDQDYIEKTITMFGKTNISGYNPFEFVYADEE